MKNTIYRIGVTGHRDLKEDCIEYYEKKVSELLQELQKKHKELLVYTPLADGADRLVAKEALKLNISFEAILPMQKESYVIDFDTESKKEFEYLLSKTKSVTILPLCKGHTLQTISTYGKERDLQYEAVGQVIADLSDVLIALWDRKYIDLMGGTGEIVNYYLNKEKHILYHLNVSRDKDVTNTMIDFKLYNDSS